VVDAPFPPLYAILDAQIAHQPILKLTEALLRAGVRLIQYRNKQASSRELFEAGMQIVEPIHRAGGIFIMNDRADVALAAGADGVHLGQDDLTVEMARSLLSRDKIVGVSTHSLSQVQDADQSSADYIAFGPIFATGSKTNPEPVVGLRGLAEARKATRKPLVAIGGITIAQARAVKENGADSIAVIQALLGAPDPGERAQQFLREISAISNRLSAS
jgi:thiamine-phosphate pyrophosphorylase